MRTIFVAGLAAALPAIGLSQPRITNLGAPSREGWSSAYAVNANGSVVTGVMGPTSRPFRWTAATGLTGLGALTGFDIGTGLAMNADGNVIVGSMSDSSGSAHPYRWTKGIGFQDLGILPGGTGASPHGVSADGSVVVGFCGFGGGVGRGWRWAIANGLQDLGVPEDAYYTTASAVSADGSIITGWANTGFLVGFGFVWTTSTGFEELPMQQGDTSSGGSAISADGMVVAGGIRSPLGVRLVRWPPNGSIQTIVPEQVHPWEVHAINAHGTVIVGTDWTKLSDTQGFFWTEALGAVNVKDYLASRGVDMTGWVLSAARGVSYDGAAMVGSGTFNGSARGWLVTGLFCTADYNKDGFVDGIDYDQFFNDFENADPALQIRADLTFDWFVDGLDSDKFLTAFEQGC